MDVAHAVTLRGAQFFADLARRHLNTLSVGYDASDDAFLSGGELSASAQRFELQRSAGRTICACSTSPPRRHPRALPH